MDELIADKLGPNPADAPPLASPCQLARAGPQGGGTPQRPSEVGVGRAERLVVPHLAAAERRASAAEVEHGVTEEIARREAARCLRCDRELDCSFARSGPPRPAP